MFADKGLAERHVRFRQGLRSASVAEKLWPDRKPTHFEICGSSASFVGDGSPLSQVNGFGFFEAPEREHIEAIRAFYKGRTGEFEIVMNSFSPPGAWNLLLESGAWIENFENVYVRDCENPPAMNSVAEIVEIKDERIELWADVSMRAFFSEELPRFAKDLRAIIENMDAVRYLALVDGEPAAAASNIVDNDVGFLGGAAVLPSFRGLGIQRDLIARRIQDSVGRAKFLFIETLPGLTSHRNAVALGFELAFVQASLKMKP